MSWDCWARPFNEYSASPATTKQLWHDQQSLLAIDLNMGTGHQMSYLKVVLNNDIKGGSYLELLLKSTEESWFPLLVSPVPCLLVVGCCYRHWLVVVI
jgi:hypothetical protein